MSSLVDCRGELVHFPDQLLYRRDQVKIHLYVMGLAAPVKEIPDGLRIWGLKELELLVVRVQMKPGQGFYTELLPKLRPLGSHAHEEVSD